MPIRTLLILIAVAVVVLGIKRIMASNRPKLGKSKHPGKMVQCDHCGMYVPEPEALQQGGRYYCSASHRDTGSRR